MSAGKGPEPAGRYRSAERLAPSLSGMDRLRSIMISLSSFGSIVASPESLNPSLNSHRCGRRHKRIGVGLSKVAALDFPTMPRQRVGDIEIYYEIHGDGPQTLAMIRGLGSNLTAWYEQVSEFSRHFRVLVFDNRGAGRTDKPDAPYSIAQMASDTAGLLTALKLERVALLGISMGGMIAQEFAIAHQHRLSCLGLGCTTCGGEDAVGAAAPVIEALVAAENANPEQRKLQVRSGFTENAIANRREIIERHEKVRAQYLIPPFSYQRQLRAA